MKDFPINPNEREIIIAVDEDFTYRLKYDPDMKFSIPLEEKCIFVCPVDNVDLPPILKPLIRPNNVYIRSPFDDMQYFHWKDAIYQIPRIKHEYFLTLCGLLGARSAKIEEAINEETNNRWTWKVDVALFIAKGEGSIEKEYIEKLMSLLSIEKKWNKRPPNIERAEAFLVEKKLIGDPIFFTLLEEVKWNPNIEKYKIRIDISREINERLSVLAKLDLPKFNIDINYIKNLIKYNNYILQVEIEF